MTRVGGKRLTIIFETDVSALNRVFSFKVALTLSSTWTSRQTAIPVDYSSGAEKKRRPRYKRRVVNVVRTGILLFSEFRD